LTFIPGGNRGGEGGGREWKGGEEEGVGGEEIRGVGVVSRKRMEGGGEGQEIREKDGSERWLGGIVRGGVGKRGDAGRSFSAVWGRGYGRVGGRGGGVSGDALQSEKKGAQTNVREGVGHAVSDSTVPKKGNWSYQDKPGGVQLVYRPEGRSKAGAAKGGIGYEV